MNKIMLMVLVGLVVAAGNAQACGKCSKGKGAGREAVSGKMAGERLGKITKGLNLSPDQKAQVQSFLEEKEAKMKQIMEEKHAAMQALSEDFHAKVKGILNEEQIKQWEAKKNHCPDCKKGKLCPVCKAKKEKKSYGHHHGHEQKEQK